ncbi:MAG: TIGR04197 family type VII secretion effector [Oscillospiraceae bacterium]|nr:TIGR04197 family type VII secretion effector [Oscillospiraceae bacterium]
MSGTIRVNHGTITSRATALQNAGSDFNFQALSPTDTETTSLANSNAQSSFEEALEGSRLLDEALNASGRQLIEIRRLLGEVDSVGGSSFNQPQPMMH